MPNDRRTAGCGVRQRRRTALRRQPSMPWPKRPSRSRGSPTWAPAHHPHVPRASPTTQGTAASWRRVLPAARRPEAAGPSAAAGPRFSHAEWPLLDWRHPPPIRILRVLPWGGSSAGRAPRSHRGGQGFDPPPLHHGKAGDHAVTGEEKPRDAGLFLVCSFLSFFLSAACPPLAPRLAGTGTLNATHGRRHSPGQSATRVNARSS